MKQLTVNLDNKVGYLNVWYGGISGSLFDHQMGTVATIRVNDEVYTGCAWHRNDEDYNQAMGERKALERMIETMANSVFMNWLEKKNKKSSQSVYAPWVLEKVKKTRKYLWTCLWDAGWYFGELSKEKSIRGYRSYAEYVEYVNKKLSEAEYEDAKSTDAELENAYND